MMFSDEEIKDIPENNLMRPGDEIISIREVCLTDKFDKKYRNEAFLSHDKNDLEVSRSLFRDGFFPDGLDPHQARFAWTEEDGNIASLVSEPGFGTTGQTSFGKDLDAAFKSEMKEADTSSSVSQPARHTSPVFGSKNYGDSQLVSSTSTGISPSGLEKNKIQGSCKIDKTDPRSRFHFVKYVKRHGRTVKLWECGICRREFQHQYTLMRHLPTHTDERNFHCDECGKSFRQLSTLSQHRAIHSADRPYACEVCNKTFNRVSTLISHRKTHSNEKPYRCHLCPKGFHQKGNLRNHLFTHTNERPYRCNICYKGFNQQSNLVCHKNKAHPDDNCFTQNRVRNVSRLTPLLNTQPQPDSTRLVDHCEVTSSVGPTHTLETPTWSTWSKLTSWGIPKSNPEPGDIWNRDGAWGLMTTGVIVDPIKTYHMGVALATRQTPFALLKPDHGAPVLVKVVDTKLPGGKQMLVPATAEDLRVGGKIVLKNDNSPPPVDDIETGPEIGGAVQIRVPVVATVIPRFRPGGRLHLAVEEPHAYHTALSADVGEVNVEPCTIKEDPEPSNCTLSRAEPIRHLDNAFEDVAIRPSIRISSTCALPPPAPSPPLDLISMDLFEPMECIPMGPQITAVDSINEPPHSDDSDIFIGEFEEGIPLSDSE